MVKKSTHHVKRHNDKGCGFTDGLCQSSTKDHLDKKENGSQSCHGTPFLSLNHLGLQIAFLLF